MASPPMLPPKPRQSDSFRPKLPLDPFGDTSHEPWPLRLDNLPSFQHRQHVILLLGAPSSEELTPLLHSSNLSNSLLIFATHLPRPINDESNVQPTVRVLRLASPLAIEDAGAVRFVKVLEHAERVARVWRRHGGSGIEHEDVDSDSMAIILPSTPVSPSTPTPASRRLSRSFFASRESLPPRPRTTSPSSRSQHRKSRQSSPTKPSSKTKLPPVDPSQRPFDALFNFLPSDIPDKSLLKQSILVTTISRPFLFSASPLLTKITSSSPSHYYTTPSRSFSSSFLANLKRSSEILVGNFNLSRSSDVYSTSPPTPLHGSRDSLPPASPTRSSSSTPGPISPTSTTTAAVTFTVAAPLTAHLIHLLPPCRPSAEIAREKLIKSMESFLLSFSYPHSLAWAYPSPLNQRTRDDNMDRAIPYFMPASILGTIPILTPTPPSATTGTSESDSQLTIADLILSGALDYQPPQPFPPQSPSSAQSPHQAQAPNPKDIVIADFGDRIPPPPRAWIPNTGIFSSSSSSLSSLSSSSSLPTSASSPLSITTTAAASSSTLTIPTISVSAPTLPVLGIRKEKSWSSNVAEVGSVVSEYTPPPTPPSKGGSPAGGSVETAVPESPTPAVRKRPAKVAGEPRVGDDEKEKEKEKKEKEKEKEKEKGKEKNNAPISFRMSTTIPFLPKMDFGGSLSGGNSSSGGGGSGGGSGKKKKEKAEKEKVELPPTPPDSDASSSSAASGSGVGSRSGTAGSGTSGSALDAGDGDEKRKARGTSFFGASFLGLVIDGHGHGGGGEGSRGRRASFFGDSGKEGENDRGGEGGAGSKRSKNRGPGGGESEEGGNKTRWKKFWIAGTKNVNGAAEEAAEGAAVK